MRRLSLLAGLLLSVAAWGQDAAPPVKVHYVLDARGAAGKSVTVEMTVSNAPAGELQVAIPTWRPGSYRIQDYAGRLKNVTGETVDPLTWKVKVAGPARHVIKYTLTPRDISDKHCFLEGPGTWMYPVRHKDAACTVRFILPDGWKAGSGLTDLGDGIFGARDYDTFADCPIELGGFEEHAFEQDGVKYELVVRTPGPWDSKGLIGAIKKIVREQNRMFGGAPFERYVFLYRWHQQGFGGSGLEHLNSTDIGMPYAAMKETGIVGASITSHEYFHAWNVKRIRPLELGPFDYTQPVRSVHLWLSEGVTSYYGDLTLARTRIWDERVYLRQLAGQVETLQNNPARRTMSVEEASRTVWDRSGPANAVDYYNKGELLGWLIDLKIRLATKNQKSFDDVMRLLYTRYVAEPSKAGKGPIGVGFPGDGILKAINEVSGTDFGDFYKKYISGTEELPYEEVCKAAGLDIALEPQVRLISRLRGVRVINVQRNSADEKAGLKPGDRIATVSGEEVTSEADINKAVGRLKAGQDVVVTVRRDGSEKPIELRLQTSADQVEATLKRRADPTPAQKTLIDSWLKVGDY